MFEIALTALTLTLAQEVETDPWVEIDGEWRRHLTCSVDTNQVFRMPQSKLEADFILGEGDQFGLILHGTNTEGFTGISVLPPNNAPEDPIRTGYCDMQEDGSIFRCNIEFLTEQVIEYYGNLGQHRFHILWIDGPVGLAGPTGSDASQMMVRVTSGVCLD